MPFDIPAPRHVCRHIGAAILFLVAAMLAPVQTAGAFEADTPVTPNSSPETRAMMTWFAEIYGKKILSGQHDSGRMRNGQSMELEYITNATGKLPALLSLDVMDYTDKSPRRDTQHRLMRRAIDWQQNRHGVVQFCWHWRAPMQGPGFYTKETPFSIDRAVTPGTPEHEATLKDMDMVAEELAVLRDAHVPVLWRPLHEANGRWFWWGAGGPEPFKKLWWMMFENFTARHAFTNLVWVFSPGAETDLADWYPGDAFVDIIGVDHYPMDDNHRPAKDIFDELNRMGRGRKLVALGENGPVPDIEQAVREKAGWLFFTTWSGSILFEKTTREQLRQYYNHPHVLNLGDLPNLTRATAPGTGKPARLGFPAAPGDVAINGTRRMPVTVAVQDARGQTVREGSHTITLGLVKGGTARLTGTLTVPTVNGIATFPDVRIDAACDGCSLTASSPAIEPATSPAFHVGPGAGLLREWWTNGAGFTTRPEGTSCLDRALELPVQHGTNFASRIRGVLIPPLTGQYRFWIANAGTSELWLGTNDSPASMTRITGVTTDTPYAKWPHVNEAESSPVALTTGIRYSFEIRHWQRNGSIQLHVRWQMPDGVEERPIPAFRFDLPK
jgi:hypothetical protein